MTRISITGIVFAIFGLMIINTAVASETSGSIETDNSSSQICHNSACDDFGRVNWLPTGADPIVITDSGLSGYAWGEEIGWINFSPGGAGVNIDLDTGILSGYAFANTGSWINFSPTDVSGGEDVGVTIEDDGTFSGWAWVSGVYGGWMKFDCSESASCVQTDWRPTGARTIADEDSGSGSSGGGSSGGGSSGGGESMGNTGSGGVSGNEESNDSSQNNTSVLNTEGGVNTVPSATSYVQDRISIFYNSQNLQAPQTRSEPNYVESYNAPLSINSQQSGLLVWDFSTEDDFENVSAVILEIPQGAIDESVTFFVTKKETAVLEEDIFSFDEFNILLGDSVFRVTARDVDGNYVTQFDVPVRVSLFIPELITSQKQISVRSHGDNAKEWVDVSEYEQADTYVSFATGHFSYFGVFVLDINKSSATQNIVQNFRTLLFASPVLLWILLMFLKKKRKNNVL